MWQFNSVENFRPENFVIVNFYGEDTCIAWQKRNFAVSPYVSSPEPTPKQPVFVAPSDINRIRSFGHQVFIVCEPSGVYKLNQSLKICLLSHTAIGIGPLYYETFSVENDWLVMKDKKTKTDRQLFQVQPSNDGSPKICEVTLSASNADQELRKAFSQLGEEDDDFCIIANNKTVFAVNSKDVQLVYRCEQDIVDIVTILREETIAGLVLVAKNSVILVYIKNKQLIFDKVYLDSEVRQLCAGFSQSNEAIWITHIDDKCVYHSLKNINTGVLRRTGVEHMRLLAIRNFKSMTLVGLMDNKTFVKLKTQTDATSSMESEEFFNLKPEMLKGSESIMNEVCEKAKELQLWNETLLKEKDKLKRINIYANHQTIVYQPTVRVKRIAGRMFLKVKFEKALPINCHVVVSLKSGEKTTYCMKLIEDTNTVVNVAVEKESLNSALEVNVDLVTLATESEPWCLVRNYTKSPTVKRSQTQNNRAFLKAKLSALHNITAEGNLDMEKLSSIKNSIRKRVQNV